MTNLIITQKDQTHLIVRTDDESMRKNLVKYFSYEVKNYKYTPRYKNSRGRWDGRQSLYTEATGLLLIGLYHHLINFSDNNNLNVISDYEAPCNNITIEETLNFIDKLNVQSNGASMELYDYQIEAIHQSLKYERILLLSPTSSGKSVILYGIVRALLRKNLKILICVPSTSLVTQLASDFKDYSSKSKWDVDTHFNFIYYGTERNLEQSAISTWQSATKLSKEQLESYDVIIADEVHTFDAKCTSALVKSCSNAKIRIGCTGTLADTKTPITQLQGLFGHVLKTISVRDLIDSGRAAKPIYHTAVLKYPEAIKNDVDIADYHKEMEWLIGSVERQRCVTNLANKLSGNTLCIFNYVDGHGRLLYNMMKAKLTNKIVLFISGETPVVERDRIKELFKTHNNILLVASAGTFSTGLSIKQIDNLIVTSPTKSRIRFFQTLGRILRMCEGKTTANVFDIIDDIRHNNKINYTFRHGRERMLMLESENIDYDIVEVDMQKYYN